VLTVRKYIRHQEEEEKRQTWNWKLQPTDSPNGAFRHVNAPFWGPPEATRYAGGASLKLGLGIGAGRSDRRAPRWQVHAFQVGTDGIGVR